MRLGKGERRNQRSIVFRCSTQAVHKYDGGTRFVTLVRVVEQFGADICETDAAAGFQEISHGDV
jgi:hypothetical protein